VQVSIVRMIAANKILLGVAAACYVIVRVGKDTSTNATIGPDWRDQISVMAASPAPALARKLDFWMANSEVSRQSVIPAKSLLLCAYVTAYFLLSRIVDRVFMSCEIVRTREDCVTWLPS